MFPENSGMYIASRNDEAYIIKVKGVYPSLRIEKKALNLTAFFTSNKVEEAPQDVLDNMEIFHSEWQFKPLPINVFSKIQFCSTTTNLYMSMEDISALRGKYYRMVQQGVSITKVIRALSYEFKTSKEQIIKLINAFDAQALE